MVFIDLIRSEFVERKLNIAIRVDANSEIGGGHFRRCLTLAQEAQKEAIRLNLYRLNYLKRQITFKK